MPKFTIGNLNIKNGSLITGDNHRISIQQQGDEQPIVTVDADEPDECALCGAACDDETLRKNVVLVDNQYGRMRSINICNPCNTALKAISADWAHVFTDAEPQTITPGSV